MADDDGVRLALQPELAAVCAELAERIAEALPRDLAGIGSPPLSGALVLRGVGVVVGQRAVELLRGSPLTAEDCEKASQILSEASCVLTTLWQVCRELDPDGQATAVLFALVQAVDVCQSWADCAADLPDVWGGGPGVRTLVEAWLGEVEAVRGASPGEWAFVVAMRSEGRGVSTRELVETARRLGR